MDCDKCGRRAVIHQKYSGLHLCRQHFIADFESKAKKSIRFSGGLPRGNHIAVAGFRGYRSIALMYFLAMLTSKRRGITLSAIFVDDRISGHETTATEEEFAASLGFRCVRVSLCDEDKVVTRTTQDGSGDTGAGSDTLPDSLLERIAGGQGITRVACDSNLDDEALSVLAAFLRGEPSRLIHPREASLFRIPRLYPFLHIPDREIALYATLVSPETKTGYCPHRRDPFSEDVRDLLGVYSARHPSTLHSLANLGGRLRSIGVDRESGGSSGHRNGAVFSGDRIVNSG